MMESKTIAARLEELRTELRAERISYAELEELQGYAENIADDDVELLEAAGVPEFSGEYVSLRFDPHDNLTVMEWFDTEAEALEAVASMLDSGAYVYRAARSTRFGMFESLDGRSLHFPDSPMMEA